MTVRAETPLVDPERISTTTRLDESFVRRLPGARPGAGVQQLVATAPGWATEDNGLIHARGVDDGFLYVSDGIPMKDRIDTFFAGGLETDTFQSIEIIDGHIPVEYGYASGGVINIVPKSGLSREWSVSLGVRAGSERSGEVALVAGGSVGESVGIFATGAYGGSGARYLDPVDPDNFNNRGDASRLSARLDGRAGARDFFIFNVSASASAFRVTNTLAQELAGQRQRQELSDNHQSLVWQRSLRTPQAFQRPRAPDISQRRLALDLVEDGLTFREHSAHEQVDETQQTERQPDDDAGIDDASPRLCELPDGDDEQDDPNHQAPAHDEDSSRRLEQSHAKGRGEQHPSPGRISPEIERSVHGSRRELPMESDETFGIRIRRDPGDEHDPVPRSELARADGLDRYRCERHHRAPDDRDDAGDAPARDDEFSPGAHAQLF